jgi:hypothetical protein
MNVYATVVFTLQLNYVFTSENFHTCGLKRNLKIVFCRKIYCLLKQIVRSLSPFLSLSLTQKRLTDHYTILNSISHTNFVHTYSLLQELFNVKSLSECGKNDLFKHACRGLQQTTAIVYN